MCERQQAGSELPYDRTDQPVARKRFPFGLRELLNLTVDGPAGKSRTLQSQTLNQATHVRGDDAVAATIRASLARKPYKSMFPIKCDPASGSANRNSCLLRHGEQRLPMLQVRFEQPKPGESKSSCRLRDLGEFLHDESMPDKYALL